ncbi:MAG: outer membrane lipoprotein chaperone LolA [Deltaproteobacteria bacterium]|nr:outer membrane lipoprotein chaperone LolA [Deltaproteobacteria bacterium]
MHIKKLIISLLISFLLLPALGAAEGMDKDKAVSSLQHAYEKITSIEADFTQEAFTKSLGRAQTSEGRVYFKKPGKMRWTYKKPSNDEIVSDGRTIWLFQGDLNQVIEKPVEEAASLAADFLSGIGDLKKDFDIDSSTGTKDGFRIVLRPKAQQPNVKKITLEVNGETLLVEKTIVEDLFGNETRVMLRNMKVNPPLKDSLFEFTPPRGSSIVRP